MPCPQCDMSSSSRCQKDANEYSIDNFDANTSGVLDSIQIITIKSLGRRTNSKETKKLHSQQIAKMQSKNYQQDYLGTHLKLLGSPNTLSNAHRSGSALGFGSWFFAPTRSPHCWCQSQFFQFYQYKGGP